jgi:hypothetical protein
LFPMFQTIDLQNFSIVGHHKDLHFEFQSSC